MQDKRVLKQLGNEGYRENKEASVSFDMLNRHFSHLPQGLKPKNLKSQK